MNANDKVSFWIVTSDKKTHVTIKAELINTIACREKQIIRNAKQRAARIGAYVTHT